MTVLQGWNQWYVRLGLVVLQRRNDQYSQGNGNLGMATTFGLVTDVREYLSDILVGRLKKEKEAESE